MSNNLNFTKEELSKFDEKTREALEDGRICPLSVEINLSTDDIFRAAFGGLTSTK